MDAIALFLCFFVCVCAGAAFLLAAGDGGDHE